jgi:hypothetical protein
MPGPPPPWKFRACPALAAATIPATASAPQTRNQVLLVSFIRVFFMTASVPVLTTYFTL